MGCCCNHRAEKNKAQLLINRTTHNNIYTPCNSSRHILRTLEYKQYTNRSRGTTALNKHKLHTCCIDYIILQAQQHRWLLAILVCDAAWTQTRGKLYCCSVYPYTSNIEYTPLYEYCCIERENSFSYTQPEQYMILRPHSRRKKHCCCCCSCCKQVKDGKLWAITSSPRIRITLYAFYQYLGPSPRCVLQQICQRGLAYSECSRGTYLGMQRALRCFAV